MVRGGLSKLQHVHVRAFDTAPKRRPRRVQEHARTADLSPSHLQISGAGLLIGRVENNVCLIGESDCARLQGEPSKEALALRSRRGGGVHGSDSLDGKAATLEAPPLKHAQCEQSPMLVCFMQGDRRPKWIVEVLPAKKCL